MSQKVIDLKCPGCGEPANTSMKICKYCGRPIIITSFNSVINMTTTEINKYSKAYEKEAEKNSEVPGLNFSIALCYLKLKLFKKAITYLDKAIEDDMDNSEAYYYYALCKLEGKKAFLASKSDIDEALDLLNSALMIENRGIYYYFRAYLKYDYYERKFLNINPNYIQEFALAKENNVTHTDIEIFGQVLSSPIPSVLNL